MVYKWHFEIDSPTPTRNTPNLRHRLVLVSNMFQHARANDEIELLILERKTAACLSNHIHVVSGHDVGCNNVRRQSPSTGPNVEHFFGGSYLTGKLVCT